MSYLLDTGLLSMLGHRNALANAVRWIQEHEPEIFLSVVSMAELQAGVDRAPETHKPAFVKWLADTRRKFGPPPEELFEAVLVRWKELLLDLKKSHRTMTCEDSLIAATALHHGHTVATHNVRHLQPAGAPVFDPLA